MECHTIPKDPASEVLNGEDLNRLIEIAPQLMLTLAEGAGMSLCALRKMAEEGCLTSAAMTASVAARGPPKESLESRVSSAMECMKAWSASAFKSAALQPKDDDFGRRFIEHGAMCYANCVIRLQKALDDASSLPSAAPSGSR